MNRTEPSTTTLPASRPSVDRYARWTGLLVGALAGIALAPLDGGDGVLYAIPAFGLCAVAGVLAGDALTPRARGAVRTAGLARAASAITSRPA